MFDSSGGDMVTIDITTWEREDWRNAGHAYRWYCDTCRRFGPYEVSLKSVIKASNEHDQVKHAAVAEGT